MKIRFRLLLSAAFLLVVVAFSMTQAEEPGIRGFTPERSAAQRQLEQKFMGLSDNKRAEATHEKLTLEPHVAGSEADRRVAHYILGELRAAGLQAEIEEFQVLLPEPRSIKFDLLAPVKFSGPRPERVPEDPASNDPRTLPGFNGYSASGEVTAEVVYANYGLPPDYARLKAEGISAEGKIVIARYGASFRGVKAKVAEENKAAALIIFSDPSDDGYHAGDAYPKGPWRPASGVQRGSILYWFAYAGDPTTPDTGAVAGAKRLDAASRISLPKIPVIPISYDDARPILENLGGKAAPGKWQGGLPFTYHFGPGPAKLHLRVEMNNEVKPIWNVVAKIPGAERPDEIIVIGNHHDAWTFGGVDPNSGTTSVLELARGLGALLKDGWRPRRSLWLCFWDAEEQGLLGSTEWAEQHGALLKEKAVAYLNLDSSVAGDRFGAAAVPSLKQFLREVAAATPDPKGGTVLERANQRLREDLMGDIVPGRVPTGSPDSKPIAEREIELGNLGSGSDYTAFLDHLGIPSTDFGFGGDYGVYHSIFDNHRWMKNFGDPEFRYHVAATHYYGLAALRLAEADLLPFDYQTYGREVQNHLKDIRTKLAVLGKGQDLDFTRAQKAAERLAEAGKNVREKYQWAVAQGLRPANLNDVNRTLVAAEQALLLPEGLPGRPWFKHSVFAPGTYTGYASVPLPGVHESIDAGNLEQTRQQLDALAVALERAAALLEGLR